MLDKASLDCGDLDFSGLNNLDLEVIEYDTTNPKKTAKRIKDMEIIITNKVILDKKLINEASNLKLICITATGTNNVDLEAAKQKGIIVCNVTGYATSSVVQHVFMLISVLNTKLMQYTAAVSKNKWSKSNFFCLLDFPITDLENKTIGIIGYGELGKGVAKLAKAFGMRVLICESLQVDKKNDKDRVSFNELLAESDIISLHCPLTEQTENLIAENEFNKMKPTAILINTARGGIVNEQALLTALQTKQIAGAGFDVLVQEPPAMDHFLLSADLDNLIVTPHIAWASQTSRQHLWDGVISNIEAFMRKTPRNVVNI